MHRSRVIFAAVALSALLPASAWALEETSWDFTGTRVPGEWSVRDLQGVTAEEQGLAVRSPVQGQLMRQNDVSFPVDAVSIAISNRRDTEARFLWHAPSLPPQGLIQLPIFLPAGEQVIRLNLLDYDAWDPWSDRLGLELPAGTDLHIRGITLHRWSMPEKLAEMWRSFWKFDRLQPYSINFLWGPVLARTPIGTADLWEMQPPPRGWSVNRLLLPLLGVTGAGLVLHWLLRRDARNRLLCGLPFHSALFAGVAAAIWIGFDIRMTMEMIGYARTDVRTWITQPEGERIFRGGWDFDDVMARARKDLKDVPRFGFLGPDGVPLAARVRYAAYPSLAVMHNEDTAGIDVWLVYDRIDATVAGGRLAANGAILAASGSVIRRYGAGSFLFRIDR